MRIQQKTIPAIVLAFIALLLVSVLFTNGSSLNASSPTTNQLHTTQKKSVSAPQEQTVSKQKEQEETPITLISELRKSQGWIFPFLFLFTNLAWCVCDYKFTEHRSLGFIWAIMRPLLILLSYLFVVGLLYSIFSARRNAD